MVIGIRIFAGTRSGAYNWILIKLNTNKNGTSVIFFNESEKVLLTEQKYKERNVGKLTKGKI